MRNIYIGYDPREHDAYLVARDSIERRASVPVLINPLTLNIVSHIIPPPLIKDGKMYDPESDAPQSTEFARSRFAIPKLHKSGWVLFMDCDMLVLDDIEKLFQLADDRYAVMVVKHDYSPSETLKMDGQTQSAYPRKNWSSVILWNCSHEGHWRLTKERLNMWPGRDLHAFKWLQDEEIGELPVVWNHLVDVTPKIEYPKLLHYTLGTPNIPGYENCSFAQKWKAEYNRRLNSLEPTSNLPNHQYSLLAAEKTHS